MAMPVAWSATTGSTGVMCDAAISLCQGAFGLGGPPDFGDPQNLSPD